MALPEIPAALYARTVGQAELSHGDLSDERYRVARRISDDQAVHVSLIDGFLLNQMLREKVEQRTPKFTDDFVLFSAHGKIVTRRSSEHTVPTQLSAERNLFPLDCRRRF
jgi:hypothetical protein